jgi:hypothetical protein
MKPETAPSPRPRKSPTLWAAYLSVIVLYAWAYSYLGTFLILAKNTDPATQPQAAYLDAVYRSASAAVPDRPSILNDFSGAFPRYTDGVVDPLLPWLMRKRASAPPDEVFEAGKWLNFVLSGSLLAVLALAAGRAFSFSGAAAVVLMGGFGVVLERSTYFSPDALFHMLVVLAWLCALSLLRQNHLWLYGVFGILLGLAYLAKALIWPIVASFVLVSAIRSVWAGHRARKDRGEPEIWVPANQLVGFAMAIAAFLLVTGPRLSYAGSVFGDPFHSYQKYDIWLDSPADAADFRRRHPGKAELGAIPFAERPGPLRYAREKGIAPLLERAWGGALEQIQSSALGRRSAILLYGFFVFAVVAAIHRWAATHQGGEIWQVRGTSALWMLLFLATSVAVALFYAGVGNPVVPYNAMTTALFLPVLVTFVWISERYRRQLQRTRYALLVNRAYAVLMAGPIAWISFLILRSLQGTLA